MEGYEEPERRGGTFSWLSFWIMDYLLVDGEHTNPWTSLLALERIGGSEIFVFHSMDIPGVMALGGMIKIETV